MSRLLADASQALRAGDLERAGRTAEAATRIDPKQPEAWVILCTALTRIGSADAEKAMAYAIRNFAEDDPFRTVLEADRALALTTASRMDEAVEQARIAAARPSIGAASRKVVSAALLRAGLYDEALGHAQSAAEALPNDADVTYNLATALRFLGRFEAAEAAYLRALACPPDSSLTLIYAGLSSLRRWSAAENHVPALRAIAARAPKYTEEAARLYYALFKELDDLGETTQAWSDLTIAGAAACRMSPFNAGAAGAVTDALIETLPKARLAEPPPQPGEGPGPIFIFGLPRSGTTLVERILSAHSRVTAMGETPAVGRAVKAASGDTSRDELSPAVIRASGRADPAEIARLYRKYTAYLSPGADLVTEKLPHNYHYVGHMRLAFPEAPLIHVLRSPMDSLFGAYRLLFGSGAYSWSYSLADLAANYRQYRRLMSHWRAALGPAFIEVVLEDLIDDPAARIPVLLQRAGLSLEEACLTPEKAEGGVSTASSAQIRSPINRQGVGAWRRYARQLEPLRAELERDGFVDANGDAIWDDAIRR